MQWISAAAGLTIKVGDIGLPAGDPLIGGIWGWIVGKRTRRCIRGISTLRAAPGSRSGWQRTRGQRGEGRDFVNPGGDLGFGAVASFCFPYLADFWKDWHFFPFPIEIQVFGASNSATPACVLLFLGSKRREWDSARCRDLENEVCHRFFQRKNFFFVNSCSADARAIFCALSPRPLTSSCGASFRIMGQSAREE